jgi:hypothetical protein
MEMHLPYKIVLDNHPKLSICHIISKKWGDAAQIILGRTGYLTKDFVKKLIFKN